MRKLKLAAQSVLMLILIAAQGASAGTLRCGVHLISDGGHYPPGKYEILKKCGEPTYREGNIWYYERSDRLSTRRLEFDRRGLLARIGGP